jgi:hypothetical protein
MYLIERFEQWAGKQFGFPDYPYDRYYSIAPLRRRRETLPCFLEPYFQYLRDFRVRHPIMYLLFYRWWIIYRMPRKEAVNQTFEQAFATEMKYNDGSAGCDGLIKMAFWARFALFYPITVFLWIVFRTVCKFLERAAIAGTV